MCSIRGLVRHLSVGVLAATIVCAAPAARGAQDAVDPTGSSTFIILVSGTRIGTETVSISKTNTGWCRVPGVFNRRSI
jgi:hypothetical protein